MDEQVRMYVDNLASVDDAVRLEALRAVQQLAERKVDWADEVWDELAAKLDDPNSYQRSIGVMTLCALAKSASPDRVASTLDALLAHTSDEKFITSRQCLQSVWMIAAACPALRERVLKHLEARFRGCMEEKHANLLRLDAVQSMRSLYDAAGDEALLERARILALEEADPKYRKKLRATVGSG